ncbi:NUDIX domain-containing protein [Emticicia sp. CRIBPO]|uniref:NUDIX domain-containing protein n=1 Tax=Emticicia sp. CRIBPO TaxID=2683258 RepID=UPI0014124511|nr:NUDIX hydrolase [Emticicia sp. CRIBPO]NBA84246.1 NUDIX domain-containing protein [Emticicia sp. CRIBPO]
MNKEKNTWEKLSTHVPYENNWIEVQHHEVINPSGGRGIYGQVNFKNIAIGIIPLDDENYTWLVGQYRFPLDEYSWEIPEGGCPFNEECIDAAKRELKEETGLLADKWTLISKIHTSNSVCNEVGYLFLAEKLHQADADPEETEDLQVRRVKFEDVVNMVMDNRITDSLSVAGILKVARMKGI